MSQIVINVYADGRRRRRSLEVLWDIGPVSEQRTPRVRRKVTMLKLTNTQQSSLAIAAVDRRGKAAEVENIVFASSDPSVATVTADPSDPSKATLKAVNAGTAQINVTADADLGDGEKPLTGTLDVTVVAGEAVGLAISTGTPEEQPE